MKNSHISRVAHLRRAFSLVEVTLALGIVGFAAATVLALLPTGLATLRHSIEQTVESQISQQITSDILQTPFASIPTTFPPAGELGEYGIQKTKKYYYDTEGFPVQTASEAVFTAEAFWEQVNFPGSEKAFSMPLDQSLKKVRVWVSNRSSPGKAGSAKTESKGDARLHTSFSILLARREKL